MLKQEQKKNPFCELILHFQEKMMTSVQRIQLIPYFSLARACQQILSHFSNPSECIERQNDWYFWGVAAVAIEKWKDSSSEVSNFTPSRSPNRDYVWTSGLELAWLVGVVVWHWDRQGAVWGGKKSLDRHWVNWADARGTPDSALSVFAGAVHDI